MSPVLALAAPRRSSARAVPLLRILGSGIDVVSYRTNERAGGPVPDAILATSVIALPVLPPVPVAVWVDTDEEFDTATSAGVAAVLSSRPELVDRGAIHVPRFGIDVSRWPPIAPLVRSRWRARYDLPADLVVGVDVSIDADRPEETLSLAAAAVVVGDATPLALALGTPVVTSEANARRYGLRPDLDVALAAGPHAAQGLAAEIARDDVLAARLSRRGRHAAERRLDLGSPAREIRRRLGLSVAGPASPSDLVAERLEELAVPDGSPLRRRVAAAQSPFPTPVAGAVP